MSRSLKRKREGTSSSLAPPIHDLKDAQYSKISPEVIYTFLRFFDEDPNIQGASEMVNSHLFSGGVHFDRRSKELNEMAREHQSEIWTRFGKKINRYTFALGFYAYSFGQSEDDYQWEPIVLELEQVDVYYVKDIFGRFKFRYFKRGENSTIDFMNPHAMEGGEGSDRDQTREIHGVITVVERPPQAAPNGMFRIHSLIVPLIPDLVQETHMWTCWWIAATKQSQPELITMQEIEKYNELDVRAISTTGNFYGDGKHVHPDTQRMMDENAQLVESSLTRQHRIKKQMMGTGLDFLSALKQNSEFGVEATRKTDQSDLSARRIDLDPGQSVAKGPEAKAPDNLMEFRMARWERTLNTFGISLAMFSNASSLAGGGRNNSIQNVGKGSSETNSSKMFLLSQRALKRRLIQVFTSAYMQMAKGIMIEDYKENQYRLFKKKREIEKRKNDAKYYKKSIEQNENNKEYSQEADEADDIDSHVEEFDWNKYDDKEIQVKVDIPSLPDENVLWNMYTMGVLKYEKLKASLASIHGIQENDLESSPKVTLDVLHGIKPEAKTKES